jgi:hypothetical protein
MQRVLDVMKGSEFHKAVAALPGYVTANSGSVHTCRIPQQRGCEDGRSRQAKEMNWAATRGSAAVQRRQPLASAMSSIVMALKERNRAACDRPCHRVASR